MQMFCDACSSINRTWLNTAEAGGGAMKFASKLELVGAAASDEVL